ncbi:hypothetical protein OXU57_07500, partial [Haemophilus influenzae]|uniref:hypothetical protein n=1 Tax=Haemophilus influenzae TaxID=727 RepID=UPI0023DD7874
NFRLFERSEFSKFPLSKFNGTKETRKSRVAFLLLTFSLAKQRKSKSPSAKPDFNYRRRIFN